MIIYSKFDHRQLPEGAPNAYSADYLGTIAELIDLRDNKPDPEVPADGEQMNPIDPPLSTDKAEKQRNIVEYWPFAVLVILVICLIITYSKLRQEQKRRKRRAMRKKQVTR